MAPRDSKPTKSTGRPLGPTGEAVRANIKQIRDSQGMSQSDLSSTMGNLGRSIPPLGIHRIENGDRRVDVDDLVGFAVALSTTPATLLMPKVDTASPEDQVKLLDVAPTVSAKRAWEWITGRSRIASMRFSAFVDRSWPSWERERYEDDLIAKHERGMEELTGQLWPRGGAADGDD